MNRRKLLTSGLAIAAGAAALPALKRVAAQNGLIPPDASGPFAAGATLTYAANRILARHSMAREFPRSAISKSPFPDPTAPLPQEFRQLEAGGFKDWRVSIDGLVDRPAYLSLEDIRKYPARSHITHLACEEGWSYIAEWTGAPLSALLENCGLSPKATHVVYLSIENDWWDSLDIDEALHPQTMLAYSMNGADLPVPFGGPLRMRVPRQLGYKNVKYIRNIEVTDNIKAYRKGLGSASPEAGYSWFAGI